MGEGLWGDGDTVLCRALEPIGVGGEGSVYDYGEEAFGKRTPCEFASAFGEAYLSRECIGFGVQELAQEVLYLFRERKSLWSHAKIVA